MNDRTIYQEGVPGAEPVLPDGLHVQLTFLTGPDRGMVKKLWKQTTILGRSEGDIIVSDSAASKKHTEICFENNQIVVRDLNSTNGTLLNGGRVWEAVAKNLDELTIGETVIQLSILIETDGRVEVPAHELQEIIVENDPMAETTRPQPARVAPNPLDGPLPEGVKAYLQVAGGGDLGARFEIKRMITVVGRVGSDFVLSDPDVSRRHCTVEFLTRDRVIVKDLLSTNGTFLNQRRISVSSLKNGDAIRVGSTVLNVFLAIAPQKG